MINDGVLSAVNASRGINISEVSDFSSITNNGTISVSAALVDGIYMKLQANDSILNSTSGIIMVDGTFDAYGIFLDNNSLGGTVTNNGTITAKKAGEFDKGAYAFHSNSLNAITVNNSGIMNGNIQLQKGTFTNSGKVSLPYNVDSSLDLVENFVNEASGTFEIGLQTDGDYTNHVVSAKYTFKF